MMLIRSRLETSRTSGESHGRLLLASNPNGGGGGNENVRQSQISKPIARAVAFARSFDLTGKAQAKVTA